MPGICLLVASVQRQVLWVGASGLVLGTLWSALGAVVRPPATLLDWTLWVIFLPSGAMVGLIGALLVGVVTGLLHAVIAATIPVPRHERLYCWVMRLVATTASLVVARYGLAVYAYHAIDFNWDLGWSREDFPTLPIFLWGVVLPTLCAGLGAWWAADRVAAWYVRASTSGDQERAVMEVSPQ